MARKLSANRGAFDTSTSNPCRFGANNKLRNFSNVFYGGAMIAPQKRTASAPVKQSPINWNRTLPMSYQSLLTTTTQHPPQSTSSQSCNKKEIIQKEHDRLKQIINNRTHMAGVQNLLKYYSKHDKSTTGNGAATCSSAEKPQPASSLKEFIENEAKREALNKYKTPVLGRGQQNGIISLCSPKKRASARQDAAERAKQRAIAVIRSKGGVDKLQPKSKAESSRKRLRGTFFSQYLRIKMFLLLF
ncbi:unnamed protein product [Anisakis simplex]|uniref:Mcm10 domain-containing protein n=1 Tax=Anisakis simplex TaxID=6269 RepID=A0A0M3J4U8_ANISI|nr:unnamed protein product [Anisakis simplex]